MNTDKILRLCFEQLPDGVCTLPKGHEGPHVPTSSQMADELFLKEVNTFLYAKFGAGGPVATSTGWTKK